MQRRAASALTRIPLDWPISLPSSFQDGMLLARVTRDIAPLKDALRSAIDYVQTFAVLPAIGVLEDR